MTGRERVQQVMQGREADRTPWVPFTGVHLGSLLGCTATDLLQSPDLLVQGGRLAHERYYSDGQPIAFDLQLEAEVLGSQLAWADQAPPSVISHPLAGGLDRLQDLRLPSPDQGRYPIVLEATRGLKKSIGKQIALFALVTGPLTLAMHLRGTSLFLDFFDDPQGLKDLLAFAGQVARSTASWYAEAGADVIGLVDPMISQISLSHFQEYVAGESGEFFNWVGGLGCLSSYFVCGNATPLLGAMLQTQPDSIFVDENVSMEELSLLARKTGKAFGGNIPLTTGLMLGEPVECTRMALDLMEKVGGPGFILAPGCDLPYQSKPENLAAIGVAVMEPEKAKEYAQQSSKTVFAPVVLPDYQRLSRPLIEVFTIDSATCPPCRYMVQATQELTQGLAGQVDWLERKITEPENVARMKQLGIANLPAILINGQVAFSSWIPDRKTYHDRVMQELS